MKKIVALLLALVMVVGMLAACNTNKPVETKPQETQGSNKPAETQPKETQPALDKTQPLEVEILISRHTEATNDATDVWFFKYLDWWLKEQGWTNVTLKPMQNAESEQLNLMLATDSLPDLIMGPGLSAANAVIYGTGEKMILDWTPYMNEEYMPNLMNRMREDILNAITAPDGAVYALPYIKGVDSSYKNPSTDFGMSDRMFVHQAWLDKVGKEVPASLEELIDLLRAFKEVKLESGEEVVPLSNANKFLEKYIWTGLGYYGSSAKFTAGMELAIKDGELWLPAYTEDYRYYVTLMNQLYTEGLISPDFFTMDTNTARGIMTAGRCGILCDYTLSKVPTGTQTEWISIPVFNLNGAETVAMTLTPTYTASTMWANADFECPELLALIADYLYSVEGQLMYQYGPMKGQEDPVGIITEGWWFDENGKRTNQKVVDGLYESVQIWSRCELRGSDYIGGTPTTEEVYEYLGLELPDKEVQILTYTDIITGEQYPAYNRGNYDDETTPDGAWRAANIKTSANKCTKICLPEAFLNEDDALAASELKLILDEHFANETARFVTGQRPLSELDAYFEEMKTLGAEDYLAYYQEAYASYLESYFG